MPPPPAAQFLSQFLKDRADATPDRICWTQAEPAPGMALTWGQAWHDVRACAAALLDAGVHRGARVAIFDHNSVTSMVVTQAGAMIGAVVTLLSPRLVAFELKRAVEFTKPSFSIVSAEPIDEWDEATGGPPESRVVVGGEADEFAAWIEAATPIADTLPEVSTDDPILMMLSSGTTAEPKGILLTHRNLIAHARNVTAVMDYGPDDVLMTALPLSHISGTGYSMFAMLSGASCHVVRHLSAQGLVDAMKAGCTHAALVPSLIAAVLQMGFESVRALGRLRVMVYGGAPMPTPVLLAAMLHWPNTEFVGMYGMTELAGMATVLQDRDHRNELWPERLHSVGRALPGVDLRVVDPVSRQDVPAGENGELWWRTPQTTPGYFEDPITTADLLTQEGWLRSGDIGHVDIDGYIYVEDRLKDVIITGGEHVLCSEVERVLDAHPSVRESAVIGVPDYRLGESVRALVVAADGHTIDPAVLREHVARHVAAYKVPKVVEAIDVLPRTPSGKILKRELRKPYWSDRNRRV